MKATASQETSRTPLQPEILVDEVGEHEHHRPVDDAGGEGQACRCTPNSDHCTSPMPSVRSSEKIFTPTNSASSASAMKNPASARNRRVARFSARCRGARRAPGVTALLHRAEAVGQRLAVGGQLLEALVLLCVPAPAAPARGAARARPAPRTGPRGARRPDAAAGRTARPRTAPARCAPPRSPPAGWRSCAAAFTAVVVAAQLIHQAVRHAHRCRSRRGPARWHRPARESCRGLRPRARGTRRRNDPPTAAGSRAAPDPAAGPARSLPDSAVVPTPSTVTPTLPSVRSSVGTVENTPMEPVMVLALAKISVGRRCDVVAARGGQVAHRHHDRLAGGADGGHFAIDLLGGHAAAARTVDAQHHRGDVLVLARLAQQRGERSRHRCCPEAAGHRRSRRWPPPRPRGPCRRWCSCALRVMDAHVVGVGDDRVVALAVIAGQFDAAGR